MENKKSKKTIAIVIALLLCLAMVLFSFVFKRDQIKQEDPAPTELFSQNEMDYLMPEVDLELK